MNSLEKQQLEEIQEILLGTTLQIKLQRGSETKLQLVQFDSSKKEILLSEFYPDRLKYWCVTFKAFSQIFEPAINSERLLKDQVQKISSLKEANEARSMMLEQQRKLIKELGATNKNLNNRVEDLKAVIERAKDLVKDIEAQRDCFLADKLELSNELFLLKGGLNETI